MLLNSIRALTTHHQQGPDALASRRDLRHRLTRINALTAGLSDRTDTYGDELRSVILRDVGVA